MRMGYARAGASRRNDQANVFVLCKTKVSLIQRMKFMKVVIFVLDKSKWGLDFPCPEAVTAFSSISCTSHQQAHHP